MVTEPVRLKCNHILCRECFERLLELTTLVKMERDCLLSHGSVFLLQDRLFHGSDKTRVKVCIKCGSLLSPRVTFPTTNKNTSAIAANRFRELKSQCVVCPEGGIVRDLAVPYVFLHLISQLAAVNIKIKIETKYE